MPRTTIAAVLAMLLILAPAASARPVDLGYPAYPTPEVTPQPNVMSERITDHPAPKADDVAKALAQEDYYMHRDPSHATLVAEQESTSGAGNQGTVPATAPAPLPADDDAPWLIVALAAAALGAAGAAVTVVVRRNRTRPGAAV